MMITEQFNASQKAQMNQWFDMADKSLDEIEKLFELNFSTCRDTLQEMANCCQSACDIRDIPGAFSWQTGAFKPFAEHSAQYGARLMGLASGTGREFSRSFENQWQALSRHMTGWMGDLTKPGERGPENAFDYLRNSMNAFDSVWDTVRHNLEQSQQAALQAAQPHKPAAKGAVRK